MNQIISVQVETSCHNTICVVCDSNCHVECGLDETTVKGSDIFKGCTAMNGNENCNICAHHYTHHVHLRKKWVENEVEIDVLDEKQQKLIEEAESDIVKKKSYYKVYKIQ